MKTEIEPGPVALNRWLADMGLQPITGWRWERKGMIQTINICGRKYITQAAIKEFNERADRGDFKKEAKIPHRTTCRIDGQTPRKKGWTP